jgi:carbon-monoxide dehydrogenase small subunit
MTDGRALPVTFTVNGEPARISVEARKTLADALREDLGLTGTHVGCEHGACGACTVLVDHAAVRSCLLFAVQLDGAEITTIEGLSPADGSLNPVQEAFRNCHGLQCGFCTPGFVVSVTALLAECPAPTDEELRHGLAGNLCRCTGYQGIVAAARQAADQLAGQDAGRGAEAEVGA